MRLRPLALSFAFVLLSTTAACERRVSLGTPCTSASDCNGEFICSFGRCRAGCERQTDCAGAQVCVQEAGQLAVCTLVDDTCEGANECSAGLVCSVSVCVAPCATMSCVVGSSCRTVDGSEICVRDDITDAGISMPDASNACMTGTPAGTNTTIDIGDIIGGPLEESTDELAAGVPLTQSLPRLLAVGIKPRSAAHVVWIAGTTGADAQGFVWEASYPTAGASVAVMSRFLPASAVPLDGVSAVDVQDGADELSALFVRSDPDGQPPFVRLRRVGITGELEAFSQTESEVADSQAVFPQGALFDGLEPLVANRDGSALVVALQPSASSPEVSGLYLIDGDTSSAPTRLGFDTTWPASFLLRGTLGGFAALNTRDGEVRVGRVSSMSRSTPVTWAYSETRRVSLAAMDITNIIDSDADFVLATADGCAHALLTRLDCTPSCVPGGPIRVPVSPSTTDLHLVTLSLGYALIDVSPQGADITWLDRELNIAVAREPLFTLNHDFMGNPGFTLGKVAVSASNAGLYAVALYHRGNDVRLLASAFFARD